MPQQEIKKWLLGHLNANREVTVRWDCGGDEAFVYPAIDGEDVDSSDKIHQEFEQFLIDALDIPDAGEFEMQGEGTIFLEDGEILIEYTTEGKVMMDYDEVNKKAIWKDLAEETNESILFEV